MCFLARGWGILIAALAADPSAASERMDEPKPAAIYKIAPGDTLSIFVAERSDLSFQVRVPIEGNIVLPGAGVVRAAGLSAEELSQVVASRLIAEAKLVEPKVSVSVVSYGARKAFIHGAVERPQAVDIPPEAGLTLTQAVATCGGFRQDADRARIAITRRSKQAQPVTFVVNAQRIAEGDAPELDPTLEPGDTIYVAFREPVYVLGQVEKPGAHHLPYGYPLTVSKAVALSGGFTKFARYTRVKVTRRNKDTTEIFTVDLGAVLDGQLDKDMELKPGDTVYVPERVF